MTCDPCTYANRHGWWGKTLPPNSTHCQDCHTTYPASQVWGHCKTCHTTFRGAISFDRHLDARKCPPGRVQRFLYAGCIYYRMHDERGFEYFGARDEKAAS